MKAEVILQRLLAAGASNKDELDIALQFVKGRKVGWWLEAHHAMKNAMAGWRGGWKLTLTPTERGIFHRAMLMYRDQRGADKFEKER